jgi:hypothetical protein
MLFSLWLARGTLLGRDVRSGVHTTSLIFFMDGVGPINFDSYFLDEFPLYPSKPARYSSVLSSFLGTNPDKNQIDDATFLALLAELADIFSLPNQDSIFTDFPPDMLVQIPVKDILAENNCIDTTPAKDISFWINSAITIPKGTKVKCSRTNDERIVHLTNPFFEIEIWQNNGALAHIKYPHNPLFNFLMKSAGKEELAFFQSSLRLQVTAYKFRVASETESYYEKFPLLLTRKIQETFDFDPTRVRLEKKRLALEARGIKF